MIGAKYYPSKSNRPVTVRIVSFISKSVVWVRCVDENRMPFHRWDKSGFFGGHVDGPALKKNLFDLRSTRITGGINEQ